MTDRYDDKIARLFGQLRRQDREQAPPFERTWQRVLDAQEPRPTIRWWMSPVPLAAAASAVLLVAVSVWLVGSGADVDGLSDSPLADWVAPSTGFLELDSEFLDLSTVDASALDELDSGWDLPSDTLISQAEEMFAQELD